MKFDSANKAFVSLYKKISEEGIDQQDTKCILNTGFYLTNPKKDLLQRNGETGVVNMQNTNGSGIYQQTQTQN